MTIELENVSVGYGSGSSRTVILDSASVKIAEGEAAAVTGPSGSGKTTLLRIVAGLQQPDSGDVRVAGQKVTARNSAEIRRDLVGMVFQDYQLVPFLTARENVLLPAELRSRRRSATSIADELLQRVGLEHKRDQIAESLSGGEQQRVAIARALISKPSVLLADEPTGALDAATSNEIASLLRSLAEDSGVTVLVVTHDSAVADRMHRVLTFDDRAVRYVR